MFLKVVLFWFQGRGRPYKGGTPYVATDSKPLILGLSNEVSFVSELSLKGGQTTQNTFPKICCTKIPVHQCTWCREVYLNHYFNFLAQNALYLSTKSQKMLC